MTVAIGSTIRRTGHRARRSSPIRAIIAAANCNAACGDLVSIQTAVPIRDVPDGDHARGRAPIRAGRAEHVARPARDDRYPRDSSCRWLSSQLTMSAYSTMMFSVSTISVHSG